MRLSSHYRHFWKKCFSFLGVLLLALTLAGADDALAARKKKRKKRYNRPANSSQCESYSWKPSAKSVPGAGQQNSRVPFQQTRINRYLKALQARGCDLMIESTYRDCRINSNVGGAQKSRHLCGAGADTSGCAKSRAKSVCQAQGLTYIEEGRGRYAHCQVDAFCNQLTRD